MSSEVKESLNETLELFRKIAEIKTTPTEIQMKIEA